MTDPLPIKNAVLLAGGKSSRMGCDKAWLSLLDAYHGQTMANVILTALKEKVENIVISANDAHSQQRFSAQGFTVLSDCQGFGPLAGIDAAFNYFDEQQCAGDWLLVVPCDAPNIPLDLAQRLYDGVSVPVKNKKCAYVHDGVRSQHLFLLLHRSLSGVLKKQLQQQHYAVKRLIDVLGDEACAVDFSDCPDAFVNINSMDDLKKL